MAPLSLWERGWGEGALSTSAAYDVASSRDPTGRRLPPGYAGGQRARAGQALWRESLRFLRPPYRRLYCNLLQKRLQEATERWGLNEGVLVHGTGRALRIGGCSMSSRFARLRTLLPVALLLLALVGSSRAAITTTGDVTPDPSTTTYSDPLYIGNTADGTMSVDSGSDVLSGDTYLGFAADVTGVATVEGEGSSWYATSLNVGLSGNSTIEVSNGGTGGGNYIWIGREVGSTGTVNADGPDSSWIVEIEMTVGAAGTGALAVTDGASTGNSLRSYIGRQATGEGQVTIDGAGSKWIGRDFYIGYQGNGTFSVINGGQATTSGSDIGIGFDTGSAGTVNVAGANSKWTTQYLLPVGAYGTGILNISNGGYVDSGSVAVGQYAGANGLVTVADGGQFNSHSATVAGQAGSTGAVTISGAGSTWSNTWGCYVGDAGDGRLTIAHGGHFSSSGPVVIGNQAGSIGAVAVSGAESIWNSGEVTVGELGTGSWMIADGAQTTSTSVVLGNQADSTGTLTVSGAGSVLNVDGGDLVVGNAGTGVLNVLNGGRVFFADGADFYVGAAADSRATINVDGVGSVLELEDSIRWNSRNRATLNIAGGGTVDIRFFDLTIFSSIINLEDGLLHAEDSKLRLYGPGSMLNVSGGRMEGIELISVGYEGELNFSGGRLDSVQTISYWKPFVQEGGTFAPRHVATIDRGYTLDAGTLEIEVFGNRRGTVESWDRVQVSGPVDLVGENGLVDGMLDVILGVAPPPGYEFLVIDNDGTDPIVGTFATWTTVLAPFGNNLYRFTIDYTAGDGNDIALVTQGVAGVLGDYNGDGVVDAGDYTVWHDALGATVAPYFGADGDGSGTIDEADYDVWKSYYGAMAGSGSLANSAVPEPASAILTMLAVVLAAVCRRRRAG